MKPSFTAVPAVTLNVLLVIVVNPVAPAVSVSPVPAVFRLRFENVATPATAFVDVVPFNGPVPVPIPIVIEFVAVVTTLPSVSSIDTVTAGVIELPATTLLGCCVKASLDAAPAVTLNALLVV